MKNNGMSKNNTEYNWSRAARDVTVTAINKGQLPVLAVCSMFMVVLWRLPEADLSALVHELLDKLIHGEMFAYILLAIQTAAWYTHARISRKNFTEETNRISKEKSELQNLLTSTKFKSSDK